MTFIFKSMFLMSAVSLLTIAACKAQINNAKTETVKVYGNCGMCETTIEKAAFKKKISKADWNIDTKMATITYDSNKTNLDAVLKNISLAGYDNQNFLAPDAAYNALPGCCKYDREKKQLAKKTPPSTDTSSNMKNHAERHEGMNNAAIQTNPLKPVFESYFSLKDALVKTDETLASVKSNDLQTAINAVKMEKLQMDVHTVWMRVLNELKEDSKLIHVTKDISIQRDHFIRLSKNVYELIKVAKPSENVYYQFCPMANDGKGANWLSKEIGIKNPYYGSEMLTCGKTVETIKQ
jgi:copper chaperone CopZ